MIDRVVRGEVARLLEDRLAGTLSRESFLRYVPPASADPAPGAIVQILQESEVDSAAENAPAGVNRVRRELLVRSMFFLQSEEEFEADKRGLLLMVVWGVGLLTGIALWAVNWFAGDRLSPEARTRLDWIGSIIVGICLAAVIISFAAEHAPGALRFLRARILGNPGELEALSSDPQECWPFASREQMNRVLVRSEIISQDE